MAEAGPDRQPTDDLWRSDEACAAVGGILDGPADWSVSGLSIDSRSLEPGDLFIALKDARDGHDFVAGAFEAGAGAALVSHRPDGVATDKPLLVVPDPLQALSGLGAQRRRESGARIVGVTGSVGKTSTKEMLRLALSPGGATHAPVKSFNNHIGVPLTLARMPRDSRFGVFEIGMNHAGEITPLTRLVQPHVAIVTTVAPVHIEFFDSIDGIAEAKAEIFRGVVPGGTAVINGDIEHTDHLETRARDNRIENIVTFGEGDHCAARLTALDGDDRVSRVEADILGHAVRYTLGAPGRHHAMNSLAVLAAVAAVGGDLAAACEALGAFGAGEGRGRRHDLRFADGPVILMDESYNANPASVAAALATLGGTPVGPRGRRIAVLGDMLELGSGGPDYHAALAEPVAAHGIDLVFCSGPLMRHLWEALPPERRGAYGARSADLIPSLVEGVRGGDAVTVKGSLGSRMRPLVDELLSKHLKEGRDAAGGSGVRNSPLQASARGRDEGA